MCSSDLDGRLSSSDDKISEAHIRPIVSDDDLFSIKVKVTPAAGADDNAKAKAIVRTIIKARKNYKGSGNPTFFTTEDVLTDLLLIEDTTGRVIYDSMLRRFLLSGAGAEDEHPARPVLPGERVHFVAAREDLVELAHGVFPLSAAKSSRPCPASHAEK